MGYQIIYKTTMFLNQLKEREIYLITDASKHQLTSTWKQIENKHNAAPET